MSNDTARAEAAAWYGMLGDETTVEELREFEYSAAEDRAGTSRVCPGPSPTKLTE